MLELLKRVIRKGARILKLDRVYEYIQYRKASEKCYLSLQKAYKDLMEYAPMPNSTALTQNTVVVPKYDLTIIIPAYNAEKWIKECLDSVLLQETQYTYKVTVINDGSIDNTLEIINEYQKEYSNLWVIDQENKGYSGARNVALKCIESKYIMFVDSDDILLDGAIEALMRTALKNQSDIVEGSAHVFNENGNLYDIKKQDRYHTREKLWGAPWLKIIKSELMQDIEFPEGYLYEDTIISYLLYPRAEIISTISKYVYGYRIHSSSITQTHMNKPNRVDSFWIMILMHDNMQKLRISIDSDCYALTMEHIVRTYRRCILLDEEVKKEIFVLTREVIVKYYEKYVNEKDQYYRLAQAIISYEYGKYKVLCETFRFN